jgi:hypothetical protein
MWVLACGDDNLILLSTEEGVVALEADGNRFDARFAQELNECLYWYYQKVLTDDRAVQALAWIAERYTGYAKGDWTYSVQGTMQSGRPDTSLGDTIVTMYLAWKAFKRLNCRPSVANAERVLYDTYRSVGMRIKPGALKIHRNPYHAEFCSSVFWPTDPSVVRGGWVLGPKPGRMLSRLFWARIDVPNALLAAEAKQRALAVRDLASPVPMLHDVVELVLRRNRGVESTRAQRRRICDETKRRTQAKYLPYDAAEVLPWFCERYNLTVDQVEAAIQDLNNTKGPVLLRGVVWETIRSRDLGA